jgi:hypothetical protein
MSSLFDLLSQEVISGGLGQIQSKLGTDENTARKAVPAALGTLMGALARNSSQGRGADDLLGALTRDHDGGVLDDLQGYLSAPQQDVGNGILRHVLGGNRGSVETGLGQALGLDAQSIGRLLTMLAPIVMGALGRTQRSEGLDAGGLASLLGNERQGISSQMPEALGVLGSLLDQDGDGQIADDVAKLGAGLLKNLFRRR